MQKSSRGKSEGPIAIDVRAARRAGAVPGPRTMDLFGDVRKKNLQRVAPLAVRMRPRTLDEFSGQQHFLGPGTLLRRMLEADRLTSVIFYGPPGTGKTTLAQLIAGYTKS